MDYILSTIKKHTTVHNAGTDDRKTLEFFRLQIEYACVFLLAYLWNRNVSSIDEDVSEIIARDIQRPTIGTIIRICRSLDVNREFFRNSGAAKLLDDFPRLRNLRIGHGFVFDDAISTVVDEFRKLVQELFTCESILSEQFDLVVVTERTDGQYKGLRFSADGNNFFPWRCRDTTRSFEIDNVYGVRDLDDYFRLSPFLMISSDHEFFMFAEISDRMVGRTTYNQILRTVRTNRIWNDFTEDIANDGVRRRSINGTILNSFDNNYSQYIELGAKKPLKQFLLKNRASVCATVWGHGGVGKTATVQSICDDLSRTASRAFDYIVFASAKDRAFNYHLGTIATIEDPIDSYHSLLRCINSTIGSQITDESGIVQFDGTLLLVIDDYETFPQAEKTKIEALIRSLNINHHKVLLTTRANVIIGDEFPTHELSREQTATFLREAMRSEFPDYKTGLDHGVIDEALLERVFAITSGRPLFIFQLAHIWAQSGSIDEAAGYSVKDREDAIEFLYGRIYSYLSPPARELFCAIGILVTEIDMSNLVAKLRFIISMETDEERFERAMQELIKLRIIERFENGLFTVYSSDILGIMRTEFRKSSGGWRGRVNQRLLRITRDKKTDIEQALLENANTARYSRSEAEVVDLYREILKRDGSPQEIRSQALLNLTDYMFNYRSKKDMAVSTFREYEHIFVDDPAVTRMYANYCWAERQRDEAIRILREFFARGGERWRANTNTDLELRGLSLMYRSIVAIENKEELKVARRIEEIGADDSASRNRDIRQEFKIIHDREGILLFRRVVKTGLDNLNASARQNVVTGLYNFSDVCMRIKEYNTAEQVCRFAIQESRSFLEEAFRRRLSFIQRIIAAGEISIGPGDRFTR